MLPISLYLVLVFVAIYSFISISSGITSYIYVVYCFLSLSLTGVNGNEHTGLTTDTATPSLYSGLGWHTPPPLTVYTMGPLLFPLYLPSLMCIRDLAFLAMLTEGSRAPYANVSTHTHTHTHTSTANASPSCSVARNPFAKFLKGHTKTNVCSLPCKKKNVKRNSCRVAHQPLRSFTWANSVRRKQKEINFFLTWIVSGWSYCFLSHYFCPV